MTGISDYGLIPLELQVRPDKPLGAVAISDDGGNLSVLMAPAFAVMLAERLIQAAARLKQSEDAS
jgi:hypothetical protein